jgi:hypothetical protein
MLREWRRFWASKKKTQRQATKICVARLSLLAKGAYEFWASRYVRRRRDCKRKTREQEKENLLSRGYGDAARKTSFCFVYV